MVLPAHSGVGIGLKEEPQATRSVAPIWASKPEALRLLMRLRKAPNSSMAQTDSGARFRNL